MNDVNKSPESRGEIPQQAPLPRPPHDPPRDRSEEFFRWLNFNPAVYALFVLFGIFVLYQIVGGGLTLLLFGLDFSDDNAGAIRIATLAGQLLFLLVPTLLLIRFQAGNIREFIRLKPIGIREVFFITLGVVAAQQFLQGYLALQDLIPLPESVRPFVDEMRHTIEQMYLNLILVETIPALLFVIVVIAVVPAVSEEVLFRGLVQRNFEYSFGLAGGAVAAGVIFGVYHLNPFNLVPLVSLGIIFGMLVYKTGSIVAPILAHFVNNLAAVVTVYYRREDLIQPSETDPSTAVILLVMTISGVVAAGCWILMSKAVRERQAHAANATSKT
jgi:uncharacterized protein